MFSLFKKKPAPKTPEPVVEEVNPYTLPYRYPEDLYEGAPYRETYDIITALYYIERCFCCDPNILDANGTAVQTNLLPAAERQRIDNFYRGVMRTGSAGRSC